MFFGLFLDPASFPLSTAFYALPIRYFFKKPVSDVFQVTISTAGDFQSIARFL